MKLNAIAIFLIITHIVQAAEEQRPSLAIRILSLGPHQIHHPQLLTAKQAIGASCLCGGIFFVIIGLPIFVNRYVVRPEPLILDLSADSCNTTGCPNGFHIKQLCSTSDHESLQARLQEICPHTVITTLHDHGTAPCNPLQEAIEKLNQTCNPPPSNQMHEQTKLRYMKKRRKK